VLNQPRPLSVCSVHRVCFSLISPRVGPTQMVCCFVFPLL